MTNIRRRSLDRAEPSQYGEPMSHGERKKERDMPNILNRFALKSVNELLFTILATFTYHKLTQSYIIS